MSRAGWMLATYSSIFAVADLADFAFNSEASLGSFVLGAVASSLGDFIVSMRNR